MSGAWLTPLAEACDAARYGAKAANLAQMVGVGITTAPGAVLGVSALQQHLDHLELTGRVESFIASLLSEGMTQATLQEEAAGIRHALLESSLAPQLETELAAVMESGKSYAVRSSAPGEDGTVNSFAGQYDSVLNCRSPEALARGVLTVWASLFSDRVVAYSLYHQCRPQGMGVIIQQQVEAAISGVMFTRDPRNPSANELLVEYCAGLGERLVSGQITPGRLRIARESCAVEEEQVSEDPLTQELTLPETCTALRDAALMLEELFNGPQDVEWSIDSEGRLYVLQSRPITTLAVSSPGAVWSNANIAENFPEPICPMLRSFVGRGYAAYFRSLGQSFGISKRRMAAMAEALDNLVGCHAGRLYYNLSNIHTVLYLAPGGPWLTRFFNQFIGAREFPEPQRIRQSMLGQAVEVVQVALRVVWRYLHIQRGVSEFEQRIDAYAAASAPNTLAHKNPKQLADLLRGFLEIRLKCWSNAALADTAAMVCYGVLQAMLRRLTGSVDANELLKGLPGLASAQPVERLWDLSREINRDTKLKTLFAETPAEEILTRLRGGEFAEFNRVLNNYFDTWGFRSSGELMLTLPTPQENPLPVLRLLKSYVAAEREGPAEISRRQAEERRVATKAARRQLGPLRGWVFAVVLRGTQGAIRLRERARMKQALLYTRLRHVALALGRKLVEKSLLCQPDDVLYLSMEEAIALGEDAANSSVDLKQWVTERRAELSRYMSQTPPDSFVLPDGVQWNAQQAAAQESTASPAEMLSGIGACGGRACGHAAVVLDVSEIDRIRQEQILVTRQTDPGWAAVFFMIKGLVIERGGLLSHGAIIAREYGIPAVVGVRDATRLIGDGERICVDGDKGKVEHVRD